eukprot:4499283-Amphidinium_carterae.1
MGTDLPGEPGRLYCGEGNPEHDGNRTGHRDFWTQEISLNPILESTAYAYIRWLKEPGSAPTAAQPFKEAITFARRVFGWNVEEDALHSRRIAGKAIQAAKALGEVKRPHPFPSSFLRYLEKLAGEEGDLELAYIATMVLFLTYSRSRFNAQRISREPVRMQGFLRTVVTEFKTARVRDRR